MGEMDRQIIEKLCNDEYFVIPMEGHDDSMIARALASIIITALYSYTMENIDQLITHILDRFIVWYMNRVNEENTMHYTEFWRKLTEAEHREHLKCILARMAKMQRTYTMNMGHILNDQPLSDTKILIPK